MRVTLLQLLKDWLATHYPNSRWQIFDYDSSGMQAMYYGDEVAIAIYDDHVSSGCACTPCSGRIKDLRAGDPNFFKKLTGYMAWIEDNYQRPR